MSNDEIRKNIGHATSYGYAKSTGRLPEGMDEDAYAELMADYVTVGQTAVAAKNAAVAAKDAAETAAGTATTKAAEAGQSATTATNAASAAQADADAAALDASQAMSAASTATTKAAEASQSATTATNAKDAAVTAKTAAQAAQTAAETAEDNAETSATAAAASAASVAGSAAQIQENADDIAQLKSDLENSDILTDSPTATTFANCSIYSNGAIIGSSGFNVYVFNIAGINRIKIDSGSIYAFYASMPSMNVTPSIDSMRHIRTLNNTELRVPTGANYVAVRHTTEPTVTDIDTLKRTVDDLEYIKAFNTKSIQFSVTGKYINPSGTETANAEYACTDYIDAVGGAEVTVHAFYSTYASFASYDADKNVVETWQNTGTLGDLITYTLQSNVRYVRWSVNANYIDDINAVTAYITNNIDDLIKPKEKCGYDGYEINVFKHGICIGDSLTAGTFNYDDNGVNKSDYADVNYSFPKMLSKLTGIDIYTSAVGGNTSYEWYQDHISATIAGFDFAIIQFGVNDALEYNGWTENSVNGFTGIINMLKRDNNGIKIFVATTIPALAYGGQAFNDVNNGIRELVASMNDENVILLDMAKYGSTKLKQYNAGHLTAIGYSRLAMDYKNYISWYIGEHPDEFMAVQFIGTNKVMPSEYNWYD